VEHMCSIIRRCGSRGCLPTLTPALPPARQPAPAPESPRRRPRVP
jgi:hypothetical protein